MRVGLAPYLKIQSWGLKLQDGVVRADLIEESENPESGSREHMAAKTSPQSRAANQREPLLSLATNSLGAVRWLQYLIQNRCWKRVHLAQTLLPWPMRDYLAKIRKSEGVPGT